MATQSASITLPVSNTLLEWWSGFGAIADYPTQVFDTLQEQFSFLWTGQAGFVVPVASAALDFGLIDGLGNELTGNGYARLGISYGNSAWTVDTSVNPALVSNVVAVTFPAASGAWVQATKLALFSHSDGTLLDSGALDSPVTVTSGNQLSFCVGAIKISVPI